MERAGFEVRDVESLREHYARTLRAWVANLEASWDEAVRLAGVARARVWRLYMAGSAVGFDDGGIAIHQVLGVVPTRERRRAGCPRPERRGNPPNRLDTSNPLDVGWSCSHKGEAMTDPNEMVSVRYMVDDVEEATAFYTKFLDFEILDKFAPAFADVARGNLRLLLCRTDELRRTADAGWHQARTRRLEPHPPHRRRHRRRGRPPP